MPAGLDGDTLNRHATRRGLADALIEIRQDLIRDSAGVEEWVERLARVLPGIVASPTIAILGTEANR